MKKILLFILISVFLLPTVIAEGFLDPLFEPFAGWNVGATYEKYWQFIDAFLYFVIFIGVAQMTLGKKFEGRGGRAVIVAIGLALAFAMSFWAIKNNFSFKSFGPIAGIILLILLAILLFRFLRGDKEDVGVPFAISVAVVYLMLYTFFPQIIETLQQTRWGRFAIAIFNIIAIIAIFYGIPVWVIRRFRSDREADYEGELEREGERLKEDEGELEKERKKLEKEREKEKEGEKKRLEEEIEKELNEIETDLRELEEILKKLRKDSEAFKKYFKELNNLLALNISTLRKREKIRDITRKLETKLNYDRRSALTAINKIEREFKKAKDYIRYAKLKGYKSKTLDRIGKKINKYETELKETVEILIGRHYY